MTEVNSLSTWNTEGLVQSALPTHEACYMPSAQLRETGIIVGPTFYTKRGRLGGITLLGARNCIMGAHHL